MNPVNGEIPQIISMIRAIAFCQEIGETDPRQLDLVKSGIARLQEIPMSPELKLELDQELTLIKSRAGPQLRQLIDTVT